MCAAELLAAAAAAARDAVTACRGATSVAPARCARGCLGTSRAAAAACRGRRGLEACRRAPRRAAAALAIGRVEPPAPPAGAPVTRTVRVGGARGAPVGAAAPAAGPVVAIVSAAAVGPGGRGAPLLGARTSAARGDVATFAPLRVDRPGTYVLRVAAAGLAAAAARVTVAPDPLDAAVGASPGGRCACCAHGISERTEAIAVGLLSWQRSGERADCGRMPPDRAYAVMDMRRRRWRVQLSLPD